MQANQQQHHARARGILTLSDASLLRELDQRSGGQEEPLELLKSLLHAETVDEQSFVMKRLTGAVCKKGDGSSDEPLLLKVLLRLLFDEPERETSATHLLVPLARLVESFFARHAPEIENHVASWSNGLVPQNPSGCQSWMQIAALLSGPHEQLTRLVMEKFHASIEAFFALRSHILGNVMSGEDGHEARAAGREAEAMMSCARDMFPRLIKDGKLGEERRAELSSNMRRVLFACRWTQIQCGVGGMAVAVLEKDTARLVCDLNDEELDCGARFCLARGICNSRNHDLMNEIVGSVFPLLKSRLERSDYSRLSTSNRHFLISLLDSMARCATLSDPRTVSQVCRLVIANFETSAHSPLDVAMQSIFRLLQACASSEETKEIFDAVWNGGRSPLFGPLDHFLQIFGISFLGSEQQSFASLLVTACGDIRMKTGAIRVFKSFVHVGGQGWEAPLIDAMVQKTNKTLHLCCAQHLIPTVLQVLTVEVAVKRLLESEHMFRSGNEILRLAVASHLGNQKRPMLALVIPDWTFVLPQLVSGNSWVRRYGLETAVALQEPRLVFHYLRYLSVESSQSHRSCASGSLCRFWKTKIGALPSNSADQFLAKNLYVNSPSYRQNTVCCWLATKKGFSQGIYTCLFFFFFPRSGSSFFFFSRY